SASRLAHAAPPGARRTGAPVESAPPPPDLVELGEPAPRHGSKLRKAAVLAGLGLTGLGVAAGTAAVKAPVCDTSVVQINGEGICVAPEVATSANHITRLLRTLPHMGSLDDSLASHQSDLHQPSRPTTRPLNDELTVVTWNLHHGDAADALGSRNQTPEMIERMNEQKADVYLLQEVAPYHVEELVNGLGMNGYYAQTTALQGNLILVHPQLDVQANAKRVVNYGEQTTLDDVSAPRLLIDIPQGRASEPRVVQALRVGRPDGSTAVVWNTHLMNGGDSPEERLAQAENSFAFVDAFAQPGEAVIGGGDLNSGADSEVVAQLAAHDFQTQGARIDWFGARGGTLTTEVSQPETDSGVPLSDHPTVIAQLDNG
ncbi:MAG: hypothetical protein KC910_36705, partial [Candidatus Eremiobacteraeota bacterium]|nr:hypothetical protein [Candidatus Eremiobacteraeota bacterium]